MAKKFTAVVRRFSKAQKDARAAAKTERERMLDETILTPDRVTPSTASFWQKVSLVDLDGEIIAEVSAGPVFVTVEFADGQHTQVEFQNVDACKSLLTYRKVAAANMVPNGGVNLANLVRQRDAEAEAAQIAAVADPQMPPHEPRVRL